MQLNVISAICGHPRPSTSSNEQRDHVQLLGGRSLAGSTQSGTAKERSLPCQLAGHVAGSTHAWHAADMTVWWRARLPCQPSRACGRQYTCLAGSTNRHGSEKTPHNISLAGRVAGSANAWQAVHMQVGQRKRPDKEGAKIVHVDSVALAGLTKPRKGCAIVKGRKPSLMCQQATRHRFSVRFVSTSMCMQNAVAMQGMCDGKAIRNPPATNHKCIPTTTACPVCA